MTTIEKTNNSQPSSNARFCTHPVTLAITALAGLALLGVGIAYGIDPSSFREHLFSMGQFNPLKSPIQIFIASLEGAIGGLACLGASYLLYKKLTSRPTAEEMLTELNKLLNPHFALNQEDKLIGSDGASLPETITVPEQKEIERILLWEKNIQDWQRTEPIDALDETMVQRVIALLNREFRHKEPSKQS